MRAQEKKKKNKGGERKDGEQRREGGKRRARDLCGYLNYKDSMVCTGCFDLKPW